MATIFHIRVAQHKETHDGFDGHLPLHQPGTSGRGRHQRNDAQSHQPARAPGNVQPANAGWLLSARLRYPERRSRRCLRLWQRLSACWYRMLGHPQYGTHQHERRRHCGRQWHEKDARYALRV